MTILQKISLSAWIFTIPVLSFIGYMKFLYTPSTPILCHQGMTLQPGQSCYGTVEQHLEYLPSQQQVYILPAPAQNSVSYVIWEGIKGTASLKISGAEGGDMFIKSDEGVVCDSKHKWFGWFGDIVWKCRKEII